MTEKELGELLVTPKAAVDADGGPSSAWEWAYMEYPPCYYFKEDNWYFRERAYMMWDQKRLIEWGLLDKPRVDAAESINDPIKYDTNKATEQIQSQWTRYELWQAGARGWWAAEDESRLVRPAHQHQGGQAVRAIYQKALNSRDFVPDVLLQGL